MLVEEILALQSKIDQAYGAVRLEAHKLLNGASATPSAMMVQDAKINSISIIGANGSVALSAGKTLTLNGTTVRAADASTMISSFAGNSSVSSTGDLDVTFGEDESPSAAASSAATPAATPLASSAASSAAASSAAATPAVTPAAAEISNLLVENSELHNKIVFCVLTNYHLHYSGTHVHPTVAEKCTSYLASLEKTYKALDTLLRGK